jgi:hypothetical protein
LYQQVWKKLKKVGIADIISPLNFSLIAIYVSGLILLDHRQNGERIASWLPGRAHDAINRLLRTQPLSTRKLMNCLIQWLPHLGKGYLAVDDVVVEKPFSKRCAWMGWTYSTSKQRKVHGFHVVVLLWCSGFWRIPVAFRIWRPKKKCSAQHYRKKTTLAEEMIVEVVQQGLQFEYVTGDTLYSGGHLAKMVNRLGFTWVGVLHPKTTVYYRNKKWQVAKLEQCLKLKWRKHLGVRAASIVAYLPKYGTLRLVVTKNRHGNIEVLATYDLNCDLSTIVRRKRSRWSIETLFKDIKLLGGLSACQCRVDQALVRHVAFVLLAFVVLQCLRLRPEETLGEVKERIQRKTFLGNMSDPIPLRGKVSLSHLLTA